MAQRAGSQTWMGWGVRLGVAGLAAVNAWWGGWARLAPRHFFDTFPGFGHRWTAAYPPYNEHLVTDLGATFLTLAFLLAVGAAARGRSVRALALAAVTAFNALHLSFHAGHPGELAGVDLTASLSSLVAGVIAPVVLLVLDRIAGAGPRSSAGRPTDEQGQPSIMAS